MAVMISGASIMDGALLLVAATESAPNPRQGSTWRPLNGRIKNIVVVQNKIHIVSKERAMGSCNEMGVRQRHDCGGCAHNPSFGASRR